jgi:hypothetical protein
MFQDLSLPFINSNTILVVAESSLDRGFREVLEGIQLSFYTSIEEPALNNPAFQDVIAM